REEIAGAAVDEVNVHPAVIVIIKKRAAGAGGFRQIFFRRAARYVLPVDAALGRRNFGERELGLSKCRSETGDAGESCGPGQKSQKFSALQNSRHLFWGFRR